MLISLSALAIPYILHYLGWTHDKSADLETETPFFQNYNHKMGFYLGIFPAFQLYMSNIYIFMSMNQFMVQKKRYKQAIMTQIDSLVFKERYA